MGERVKKFLLNICENLRELDDRVIDGLLNGIEDDVARVCR